MQLPYWDIYIKEKKAKSIIVGGTIAGQFMPGKKCKKWTQKDTIERSQFQINVKYCASNLLPPNPDSQFARYFILAGLSGGQRKLLLFELICQRTAVQDNLLIVLDEPFAGVTDDFVPFIVKRLNEMRKNDNNILLVTNDHVETLKKMADNTVTVSAIDRSKVKINGKEGVDRALALLAMSIGDDYKQSTNNNDLAFFRTVEFSKNGGIPNVVAFAVFAYGLFLLMYWDSKPGNESFVLVAASLVTYFTANPYYLQLCDWRICMVEEAEALLHSSKSTNKVLKTLLTLFFLFVITCTQFACLEAVIGTLSTAEFFFGILFDNLSLLVFIICLGLYTDLSDQAVQIFGAMPFMFMIFFRLVQLAAIERSRLQYLEFCAYFLKKLSVFCPLQYHIQSWCRRQRAQGIEIPLFAILLMVYASWRYF